MQLGVNSPGARRPAAVSQCERKSAKLANIDHTNRRAVLISPWRRGKKK
jgi:hypothetical protein